MYTKKWHYYESNYEYSEEYMEELNHSSYLVSDNFEVNGCKYRDGKKIVFLEELLFEDIMKEFEEL